MQTLAKVFLSAAAGKNTHGANTRGAAIGAATNGWNGSGYDDQRRATILPRVVDST